MLEKEWQEAQNENKNNLFDQSHISKNLQNQTDNIVFFFDDEVSSSHQTFLQSQKIAAFSRTLSKTDLLAKIKNALVKNPKKEPLRFIVKRSQTNALSKTTCLKGLLLNDNIRQIQEQELFMKTIVQQKEKVAKIQKEAINRERDLSLKLKQAIHKMQHKPPTFIKK